MIETQSRRRFLSAAVTTTAAFGSSSALFALLSGCGQTSTGSGTKPGSLAYTATPAGTNSWALTETIDASTGKPLLKLPPGFRYFSFGWQGEALQDGSTMPSSADGMGLVHYGAGQSATHPQSRNLG